jgi:ribonuclease Z
VRAPTQGAGVVYEAGGVKVTAFPVEQTRPRLAVFSHIVKKELPGDAGDDVVIERTRKAGYDGPLAMGQDRMTIEVGAEVKILPPQSIDGIVDFDKPDSKF